jgi:uncharacterized small protein (DUF1192 family)
MIQLIFILVLLIPILAIVLDSPVGRALAGRLEHKGLSDGSDMSAERLAFLEGEVERLNAEIQRLDEEGQFLQQLLENRPATEALPPGDGEG